MTTRAYIRVSSNGQLDGYSLTAQRSKCEAWAAYQNTDLTVYEDAGLSGRRDDRPGLTALLMDLRTGDTVLTYSLSRLARGGAVQLLRIVGQIRERGARVVFLTESIDTDTPTGRLMLTILAALAELELEQMRERTEMGRTEAAQQGIYPHAPQSLPYGYTTDPEGRIIEDPAHAETVRLIYQQGAAPYHQTAQLLNALRVPTQQGAQWTVPQVRRVILQRAYGTGQFMYRATTRPDEPETHIPIPCPPLITSEQWQAAQRDRRTNNAHKRPDLFPLTGHLRCVCGAALSGRTAPNSDGSPLYSYVCYESVRKTPTCSSNGRNSRNWKGAAQLADKARQALADVLTDPATLTALYAPTHTPDPHTEERQEVERKLQALLDLYLEQLIDRRTYEQRRATLTAHHATLTPAPPTPPADAPARADLAHAVLHSTNEELAELLDLLSVELAITPERELRVLYVAVPTDE